MILVNPDTFPPAGPENRLSQYSYLFQPVRLLPKDLYTGCMGSLAQSVRRQVPSFAPNSDPANIYHRASFIGKYCQERLRYMSVPTDLDMHPDFIDKMVRIAHRMEHEPHDDNTWKEGVLTEIDSIVSEFGNTLLRSKAGLSQTAGK